MKPTGPFRFRVRQGLNIPLSGRPKQEVTPGPEISHVALCGPDYVGLKPRMLVAEGDTVRCGQPLFQDKRDPVVTYGSPGAGTVVAVHRGARRVLESVVVRLEDKATEAPAFDPLSESEILALGPEQAARRLQQSGLWTAFRTRPFSRVPYSGSRPRSIFVTAIDTRPLAPDPGPLIRERAAAFASGLQVLTRLTAGTVYLCTRPGWDVPLPETERLQRAEFSGPHPAGLPGTHIHLLDPVGVQPAVWHLGYQDVIAVGVLFREGVVDYRRIVSLAGPCVAEPRLFRTRAGASISELTAGLIRGEASCRVLSGSVLDGRTAGGGLAFLGRYHQQVSVIREGGDRHLLGWTGIFPWRYSAARTFLKQAGHARRHAFTTAQNGRFTGMLPTRAFEKILPLDILPSPLFRALLVRDTDQAQALGCLELDEEDLALCSFVCPAKNDYGAALRVNLAQIEREG
jgi:Na+-transporting NADH:ubiquinone oxidoreductase subunit A